jgi:hypothetical protein
MLLSICSSMLLLALLALLSMLLQQYAAAVC